MRRAGNARENCWVIQGGHRSLQRHKSSFIDVPHSITRCLEFIIVLLRDRGGLLPKRGFSDSRGKDQRFWTLKNLYNLKNLNISTLKNIFKYLQTETKNQSFWTLKKLHISTLKKLYISTLKKLHISTLKNLHISTLKKLHTSTLKKLHTSTLKNLHISTLKTILIPKPKHLDLPKLDFFSLRSHQICIHRSPTIKDSKVSMSEELNPNTI